MICKKAGGRDIPVLLNLACEFIAESHWGWKYNEENAVETFLKYIESDECDVLLIGSAGFAIVAFDIEFHDEKLGYLSKFYISPEARKTVAARWLMENVVAWFDSHNCTNSFATATANIGKGNTFKNLLAKYGFKECGETLVRGHS